MKTLLIILGCIYLAGAMNALRKLRRTQAVYQFFWALVIAIVLLTCGGCATQRYVDTEVALQQNETLGMVRERRMSLIKWMARMEQRVDDLAVDVASHPDPQPCSYWEKLLRDHPAYLGNRRKESE